MKDLTILTRNDWGIEGDVRLLGFGIHTHWGMDTECHIHYGVWFSFIGWSIMLAIVNK